MPITKQLQRRGLINDIPTPLDDGEIGLAQDTGQVFIGNLGTNIELGGGETNTITNLVGDEGIFFQKVGVDFELKSLSAGANVTLSSNDDTITIGVIASGEANTYSDFGAGAVSIRGTKAGVDLPFKTFDAGTNITLTDVAGLITINAAGGGAFTTAANITSNSPGDVATDDFVFGSTTLDGIETRFLFDKSKGAFRAGPVTTTAWDDINRGAGSTAFGSETTASGLQSMAWGIQTQATNQNATAFGVNTFALGPSSTAWGWNNTTAGALLALGSTAFGQGTQATNRNSTSWGLVSQATGQEATAWGTQTVASGQNGTAWGTNTTASGLGATAWGSAPALATVLASGDYSTAFGTQTTASFDNATAWGYNTNSIGYNTTAFGSFCQAGLSEFQANTVDIAGTTLTEAAALFITTPFITNGEVVEINGVKAIVVSIDSETTLTLDRILTPVIGAAWEIIRGEFATAWGNDTVASGAYATAWGYESTSSGAESTSWGFCSIASGTRSTAFGNETVASGLNSFSFGDFSEAIGDHSVAFGTGTRAEGIASAAWGIGCQAINHGSVAFGDTAIVNSVGTLGGVAFGTNVTVSADYGVAIGSEVTVTGEDSFAIGLDLAGPAAHILADENTLGIFGGSLLFAGPTVTENVISFDADVSIPTGRTYTHHYMDIIVGRLVTIEAGATLLTRAPTVNGTLTIDAGGLWDVI